jgi:DDE superfamily endonuclease
LIEDAYRLGEHLGLAVWCCDQSGPFPTVPYTGTCWQPEGKAARQSHEYIRNGAVKVLTLFHPANGHVCIQGTTSCTNPVLHGWLKRELSAIVQSLPEVPSAEEADQMAVRACWQRWQEGLSVKPTLSAHLPPLRMLLVLDNLAGHKTPELVLWLFAHGIMPLYTPLGGSWLNMAESIQRILKRRALEGQHPSTTQQIIAWFEATARGWNKNPTAFEWGGKRAARRQRARQRRHAIGGSGACTRVPLRDWKIAA